MFIFVWRHVKENVKDATLEIKINECCLEIGFL